MDGKLFAIAVVIGAFLLSATAFSATPTATVISAELPEPAATEAAVCINHDAEEGSPAPAAMENTGETSAGETIPVPVPITAVPQSADGSGGGTPAKPVIQTINGNVVVCPVTLSLDDKLEVALSETSFKYATLEVWYMGNEAAVAFEAGEFKRAGNRARQFIFLNESQKTLTNIFTSSPLKVAELGEGKYRVGSTSSQAARNGKTFSEWVAEMNGKGGGGFFLVVEVSNDDGLKKWVDSTPLRINFGEEKKEPETPAVEAECKTVLCWMAKIDKTHFVSKIFNE